jgi:prepilin-type processing-associated H-X9-DG protein
MNNLKQCGLVFLMYAQDYNGYVTIYGGSGKQWHEVLYPDYIEDRELILCPTWLPKTFGSMYETYGINGDNTSSTVEFYVSGGPGWHRWLRIARMSSAASDYPLLFDSTFGPTGAATHEKKQCSVIGVADEIASTATSGIHLRHVGLANVLFADAHVKGSTKARLTEVGFGGAYERDYTIVDF